MLLVYSPQSSPRLQYICTFIFEFLGIAYTITNDAKDILLHSGPLINYSADDTLTGFHIFPAGLLQQTEIWPQNISPGIHEKFPLLFTSENGNIPFDIFSAAFFLISRYEEYLPYTPDEYGRFPFKSSTAYKLDFLNRPLINEWLIWFGKELKAQYSQLQISVPHFSFLPTYDIDMGWSYRNKGLLRNLGGMIKKPSFDRIAVLAGIRKDPYDAYTWLNNLHKENKLIALYFFLVAQNGSPYDKNISPSNSAFQDLIRDHNSIYQTGIHPSWQSNFNSALLLQEIESLRALINKQITVSRQHYIKMKMPGTYRGLIEAGITDDYSMGYGSINGFRASVARQFFWYDLLIEKETPLVVHPFCFMDANSYYEQQQTIEETKEELNGYLKICKETGGDLITIFHNSFLGSGTTFKGWREMYAGFIKQTTEE